METITITHFKRSLKSFFEKVCVEHIPLMITDPENGDVVVMSKAEYESWQETFYLFKSPANAKRLLDGIEQYEQSRIKS